MSSLRITNVPQTSAVASTDDLYIKTGDIFRRVPVSKLIELLSSEGFYTLSSDGIPQDDMRKESVVITPDGTAFVSSKTYSQISAAQANGAAILPEFRPGTGAYLRGIVLDIDDSSALFAFIVPGSSPYLSVISVTDLAATEEYHCPLNAYVKPSAGIPRSDLATYTTTITASGSGYVADHSLSDILTANAASKELVFLFGAIRCHVDEIGQNVVACHAIDTTSFAEPKMYMFVITDSGVAGDYVTMGYPSAQGVSF